MCQYWFKQLENEAIQALYSCFLFFVSEKFHLCNCTVEPCCVKVAGINDFISNYTYKLSSYPLSIQLKATTNILNLYLELSQNSKK